MAVGVVFVDLAPAVDPAHVPSAWRRLLAFAAGQVAPPARHPPEVQVEEYVHANRLLVLGVFG